MASILLLALISISCNHPNDNQVSSRKAINSILDQVENVMDEDAKSADSLVQLIDPHSIKGRKLRARYGLFYTAVQFKNYQPFSSDSLIMESVRYYSISKNTDYRFLSYYYLGCVYHELGKITDASVAFAQAEQLVDMIGNDHWKGLLYSAFSEVYAYSCDYYRQQDYLSRAEQCFERACSERHRIDAKLNLGYVAFFMREFKRADSILQIVEKEAVAFGDSILSYYCFIKRLSSLLYLHEPDLATDLLDQNGILIDESSNHFNGVVTMSHYYIEVGDYEKAASLLDRAEQLVKTEDDSIYYNYYNYRLAYKKGEIDKAFYYYGEYSSIQSNSLRKLLNQPVLGAQYDNYRTTAELEYMKARNKITILVASIIICSMGLFIVAFLVISNIREDEDRIRDYISSIDELTTQISVKQDKISKLNDKVREMLRQQFNPTDYLYTRYYEQIDDSKKAERLYGVIRHQMEDFTNPKNINRIDELLDESFDGIMTKVLSLGLDIKEKDLLLLRFVLAGFSSKSIAAILGDTHLNINQRKKRLLDKIQIASPKLMDELSIALNSK